jgi:hypothetical protein
VALVVATSVGLLGIGELQIGLQQSQSRQGFVMAETCLEEGLIQLRDNAAYAGGNLTFGEETCTIEVINNGSGEYTLNVRADVKGQVRKIQADATRTEENLAVSDWQEIP